MRFNSGRTRREERVARTGDEKEYNICIRNPPLQNGKLQTQANGNAMQNGSFKVLACGLYFKKKIRLLGPFMKTAMNLELPGFLGLRSRVAEDYDL